jgi:hypothetical protein
MFSEEQIASVGAQSKPLRDRIPAKPTVISKLTHTASGGNSDPGFLAGT